MYSDGRVSNYFGMGKSQSSGTFCEKTRKSSNFGVGMVIALRILWGLGKSNVGGNWGNKPKNLRLSGTNFGDFPNTSYHTAK